MESLIREIQKEKEKALKDAQVLAGDPKSKVIKRCDLEKVREQEYWEKMNAIKNKRKSNESDGADCNPKAKMFIISKSAGKYKDKQDESIQKFINMNKASIDLEEASLKALLELPEEEMKRRLRQLAAPVKLFGETNVQRVSRLRTLQINQEKSNGHQNEFMKTIEKVEQDLTLEAINSKRTASEANIDEDMHPLKKSKWTEGAMTTEEISLSIYANDKPKVYSLIYAFLKRLLHDWTVTLSKRPESVRISREGKIDTATQQQTVKYLKALLKKLRKQSLDDDVLKLLTEICFWMQKKDYVNAVDAFLRLSIGNAAWPIGVTMVGIHERSSREKICSSEVAHVLNDETTRKWITSLKRLISMAEVMYPPDSESKTHENI